MSGKKAFKNQASSSNAAFGDGYSSAFGFGAPQHASPLSYVYEPPDLSRISRPDITVAFKNLQKKDSTTKSRALEELESFLTSVQQDPEGVEDFVLDAWTGLYPRISIDSSRRVRQLAHVVQGLIATACGRRTAKRMPTVAGAWLSGTYDNDRVVARSAQESFAKVFASREKQEGVWKTFHRPVLEYCRDAILKESSRTLSDERTVSPDNADAKYARTVGTALLTVVRAVEILPTDVTSKDESLLEIVQAESVWKLSSSTDAFLRKAVYRFLTTCVEHFDHLVPLPAVQASLLQEALLADHRASTREFVQTLTRLTEAHPEIWGPSTRPSKKSPLKNLCRFLKKGTQGAQADIWGLISGLLQAIPLPAIYDPSDGNVEGNPSSGAGLPVVLAALKEATTRKDEPSANQEEALTCFLDLAQRLQAGLEPPAKQLLYEEAVLPLISGCLGLQAKEASWPVKVKNWQRIRVRAVTMAVPECQDVLAKRLKRLSEQIIQSIDSRTPVQNMSLPTQTMDLTLSQDSIVDVVGRWYEMKEAVLSSTKADELRPLLKDLSTSEVRAAMASLTATGGKQYSAAALVAVAVQRVPGLTSQEPSVREDLHNFVHTSLPSLIASPSGPYLLQLLSLEGSSEQDRRVYNEGIKSLVGLPDKAARRRMLASLVSSPWPVEGGASDTLAQAVQDESQDRALSPENRWRLCILAVNNPSLPGDVAFRLLRLMADGLSLLMDAPIILRVINNLLKEKLPAVQDFISSPQSSVLISRAICLSESSGDLSAVPSSATESSEGLSRLTSDMSGLSVVGDDGPALEMAKPAANDLLANPVFLQRTSNSLANAVWNEVTSVSPLSLPIESVVSQAKRLLDDGKPPSELLPGHDDWQAVLRPYLRTRPDPSLALTNALGGLVYLIEAEQEQAELDLDTPATDPDGYSNAFRMATYVVTLLRETSTFTQLSDGQRASIFQFLTLFSQIATDHLSVLPDRALWGLSIDGADTEVLDGLADMQSQIATWIHAASQMEQHFLEIAMDYMKTDAHGRTVWAYYSARAFIHVAFELQERTGKPHSGTSDLETESASIDVKSGSFDPVLASMRLLTSHEDQPRNQRCNQLVSMLMGVSEDNSVEHHEQPLQALLMLNLFVLNDRLVSKRQPIIDQVPQRRRVLLMQSLTTLLELDNTSQPVMSETLKLTNAMAPALHQIYGEFWESILDTVIRCLKSTSSSLPVLHACLRLCSTMRALATTEETTEDLREAWTDRQETLAETLFSLVQKQSTLSEMGHQPRKMVNDLLARQIAESEKSISGSIDIAEILPIMASEAVSLQRTAFQILHQRIPMAQEQVSIDAALSKETAIKLPDPMLSMIREKPDASAYADLKSQSDLPSSLTRYLLCWLLVFDHWTNASYKVQGEYVSCVKESGVYTDLLSFIFQLLAFSRGHNQIINPSKYDVESYIPDRAENPEADAQHLLAHLYYLCLKRIPLLTKAWWRSDCPRPLEKAVADWTEKHFSPLIVRAELDAVAAWDPNPEAAPGDAALEVKVAPRAREATAAYPVDETSMAVRVALPAAYPLQPVEFRTARRVAVDEKRWAAWLNTSQIVANFASASQGLGCVVDGLAVWRRNVVGAMKAQSECAICYSVVSPDKMLPTKRCGTCKNVFHGHCLFRWFKSSSTSGCPLCRNPFNYG